ncbi:uncharacterized protein Tco025E_01987 [Trypanosoma conorhini]|uniref:Uncharacterized protein n=1 Tax=Trypanosoma conorhini TaxID=83891 RepID=A0A422Q735_9TRYP|nr:uncharacterized protein Tco025E_01987 [Trypanosoma conorhini]RNF25747.1 hypothetical protein Tco025E_01987 [Trypanosoma conorhini]
MTDLYNEAAYYPTADPARMGPGIDLFAAIPYLCEFRLSRPRVIYRPPTLVDLLAAGAIPVEDVPGPNGVLPTITLSAEVAPCRGNFQEASGTVTSSRFLLPPEREGAEAIAEELQRGLHDTSDQEYWSEEYWRSLQTEELNFEESPAAGLCFQSPNGPDPTPSLKGVSTASAKRRTRGMARQGYGLPSTSHSRNERLDLRAVRPPRPTSCECGSSVSSPRGHPALGPSSRAGARMCGDREGRLVLQGVSSPTQPARNVAALANMRAKAKRPRQAPGCVAASLKPKSRFGTGASIVKGAAAFRVYPPEEKSESLLINASGTGHFSMAIFSSSRERVESGKIDVKPTATATLPDARNARPFLSRVPIAGHPHPETLSPAVTSPSLATRKHPPAGRGGQGSQRRPLGSVPSGGNLKPRGGGSEGGSGNNAHTEKTMPMTSGKDATVSRHNSGVLVSVEATHAEESQQVFSRLERKEVEGGERPVAVEVGALGSLRSKPLLRDGKQTPTKCCTMM